jgi:hypothetical protein
MLSAVAQALPYLSARASAPMRLRTPRWTTWTKVYQHTAFEVHGIDISQARNGGNPSVSDLITDAAKMEMDQLFEVIYNAVYTQWKADIDSASTYSDAALSRSTYPVLASQEESTDTQITLALMRSHSNACRLNKSSGPKNNFQFIMETATYEALEPKVAALHSWVINDSSRGEAFDGGYQALASFEGQKVFSPAGMTTGDIFYGRKEDFRIRKHRDLSIEQVPSGRDSAKFVMRVGINGYVTNPGFCGKMTSKD